MEDLSYARSIVVYGPDYGVAIQYFRKAGLPTVVSSVVELRVERALILESARFFRVTGSILRRRTRWRQFERFLR